MKVAELQKPEAPKYWKLADHLMSLIRSGEVKPGDRLPSFAQLRADYGASRPTAERAHAILEQHGLIERRSGQGIFVASQLPAGRLNAHQGIIGISGGGFNYSSRSSYWAAMLGEMRETAECGGAQILLLDHTSSRGWEKADGIIICEWSGRIARLLPPGIAWLSLMTSRHDGASVCTNELGGMRAATEHLLGLGHRRIAYLHAPYGFNTAQRMAGYREALQSAQIPFRSRYLHALPRHLAFGDDFVNQGRTAMRDWLAGNWEALDCTAILAHNDETAIGVMQALREANVCVPEDVSVVGFDGLNIGDICTPRLTTIKVPLQEIGARAVEMLLQQLNSEKISSQHCVLPSALLMRESTGQARR